MLIYFIISIFIKYKSLRGLCALRGKKNTQICLTCPAESAIKFPSRLRVFVANFESRLHLHAIGMGYSHFGLLPSPPHAQSDGSRANSRIITDDSYLKHPISPLFSPLPAFFAYFPTTSSSFPTYNSRFTINYSPATIQKLNLIERPLRAYYNYELRTTNSGVAAISNHIRKGLRQNSIIRASWSEAQVLSEAKPSRRISSL